MKIDFEADLVCVARRELEEWGVETLLLSNDELITRYFVLQHRVLDAGPYALHVSSEAMLSFIRASCKPEVQRGIGSLLARARRREVLWPHQSRRLLARTRVRGRSRPSDAQHDGLLNDWGIQHLHLGQAFATDGFVDRTSTLAFVMARQRDLYVIDFRKHPKGDWSDIDLLEIVEKHWPHVLPALNGVTGLTTPAGLTHQQARNAGLTLAVQLSTGRVLAPPGGGYSTSGHSFSAIARMDRFRNSVRQMEESLLTQQNELQEAIGTHELELHLDLDPATGLEVFANGKRLRSQTGERLPAMFSL